MLRTITPMLLLFVGTQSHSAVLITSQEVGPGFAKILVTPSANFYLTLSRTYSLGQGVTLTPSVVQGLTTGTTMFNLRLRFDH